MFLFMVGSFLLFGMACSVLAAEVYSASDVLVTNDTFTDSRSIAADDNTIYEVAPGDFKHITITLSGSTGYLPRLIVYDPATKEILARITGVAGQTLSYERTTGIVKGKPRTYYLVVDTYNSQGETFDFSYEATAQDDAGLGTDAPFNFQLGLSITPGDHQGYLGDEDTLDYYHLDMVSGETITMELTPERDTSLRLVLIDNNLNTKVDFKAQLEGASITQTYTSPRDQTVSIGIEGEAPYMLNINSTETKTDVVLPPPVPSSPNEIVTNTSGLVAGDTTPSDEQSQTDDTNPTAIKYDDVVNKDRTSGSTILLIVIVLIIAIVVWYFVRKPKESAPQK